MKKPLNPLEIFLHPGDYYFAGRDTRISTVVGSCIAMTFWHPQLLVGGMCHYMLPKRSYEHNKTASARDGLYASGAVALLLEEIGFIGTSYKEYQVKLFGGGNMFPVAHKRINAMNRIGARNVQAARQLVQQHGFSCVGEHLGGIGHRSVSFEVWSGKVQVKHANILLVDELKPLDRRLG
ncbi:chemotaxis protein CheD [Candidatus Methylobacter oryzae]|uniref:Probable chemoreceptor glutamine deamidase CheD n=1 Tax=Candidatus Methylobacter oryzae TaxID=2497749 RepID=A0ABY3CG80_9GAMM|nr:chemotaxis protein CheD [Candidatus Methylobacter oryzae]TRX02645.1 chemotaxis protein CheD [Candidatus Methylobacter oryzae]